ncbi:MAG: 50S ribosomal protein L4 [Deltaproteobacteria bacterium]|jgi:Ribosomal protein L4|uniref:Large ribosomal subunit protein uL4 n=1 Tax=Candidatus Acidulodesulfobacterium acidiphilum TaxID=2597224 RepID=A0A520XCZ5_9DELT|nr:50S ribosomal protein L4 [Deltaproteobacteria bacterium]MCL6120083.1 50S ribosomal protein L4 [Deltaproteobacteria bacterium]MDA8299874.1 50S ribosomal protein L4 [Deltaproteobacteria bacterium]RZV38995.1 MAG: 50S ribosomal protein L4 [Candidatus Acidulodesulfobacterium acidiphilum]
MGQSASVVNISNKPVGNLDLNESVYMYPVKEPLIKEFVLLTLANKRLGLASTKNRKIVSGGGIKPWKQKGTGRARAGSTRSPIWKGGGTVFGPTNEVNYKKDMPKKARKAAIKSALSHLLKEDKIVFVEDFELPAIKTKEMASIFNNLGIKKGLLVLPTSNNDSKIIKSTRNLMNYKAVLVNLLNIIDLLKYEKIIITLKANEELERNLSI